MNKKIIVMYEGGYDYSLFQIFDSMYGVLIHLKNQWNTLDITLDELKDSSWQRENEIKIVEAEYYPTGDDGSVGEELLSNIPEIEEKCRAVRQAVRDLNFPLNDALEIYKVTREQYGDHLIKYPKY